jgi:dihydrofolate synthase / folylpolyglutamate synthase
VLPSQPEIAKLIADTCLNKNAPLTFVNDRDADNVTFTPFATEFDYASCHISSSLAGTHQVSNAMVAMAAAQAIRCKQSSIQEGISAARLPGRFHIEHINNKTVIFDVGHNPAAALVLGQALKQCFKIKSICFVIGIMKDKDYPAILNELSNVAPNFILTRPSTNRAAAVADLFNALPSSCQSTATLIPDVGQAAISAMAGKWDVVCITGSFYTVGESMKALNVMPY